MLLTDNVLPEGDKVLMVTEPDVNADGSFSVNVPTEAGKLVTVMVAAAVVQLLIPTLTKV